jgi:hypothetical protein
VQRARRAKITKKLDFTRRNFDTWAGHFFVAAEQWKAATTTPTDGSVMDLDRKSCYNQTFTSAR